EVAPLLEQAQRPERVVREVEEELRERVPLQHGGVGARLERARTVCPPRRLLRLAGDRRRIDLAGAPRGQLGVAGRLVTGREDERGRVGQRLLGAHALRRGDGDACDTAREVAVRGERRGVDRRGGQTGLVVRLERRRVRVV